ECPVQLTHIVELPMYVTIAEAGTVVSVEEVEQYLEKVAARLPEDVSSTYVVRDGRPGIELVALSEEIPDAMIVMATHGRGGLPRALLGSVADKVVRSAKVPVGLVRANDPETALPDKLERIVV